MDEITALGFSLYPDELLALEELRRWCNRWECRQFEVMIGGAPYFQVWFHGRHEAWDPDDMLLKKVFNTALVSLNRLGYIQLNPEHNRGHKYEVTVLAPAILRADYERKNRLTQWWQRFMLEQERMIGIYIALISLIVSVATFFVKS